MRVVLGKYWLCTGLLAIALGAHPGVAAHAEFTITPRPSASLSIHGPLPVGVSLPTGIGDNLAEEVHCLAQNVYFESRSEPLAGQIAVAKVTLNRVLSAQFPDTICGVVRQGGRHRNRCQFSWYCDGKPDVIKNQAAWHRALNIAYAALFNTVSDPTRGALYFHAHYVNPGWAKRMRRTVRIGNHLYYRDS